MAVEAYEPTKHVFLSYHSIARHFSEDVLHFPLWKGATFYDVFAAVEATQSSSHVELGFPFY
jgi:hypothetical protein